MLELQDADLPAVEASVESVDEDTPSKPLDASEAGDADAKADTVDDALGNETDAEVREEPPVLGFVF